MAQQEFQMRKIVRIIGIYTTLYFKVIRFLHIWHRTPLFPATSQTVRRGGLVSLRARAGERGSTLLEFALVFILFMTILLGIAGFGHALYAYHFVSNAAREATRWATVNGSTCASDSSCAAPASQADVANYIKSITPPGITPGNLTVAACGTSDTAKCADSTPAVCATTSNAPGCDVEVQVSYQFNFIFPLLPTSPLTMSSTSEMVISH